MKWVKDLKVKMKLIAGFLTVAALMVVMGIFGLRSMGSIRENLSDIYENQLLPITHMAQVRGTMLRVRTNVLQHIIAQDAGKMHEFEEQIAKLDTAWDEAVGKFEKAQLTADEKVTLGQLKQAWTGYKQGRAGEGEADQQRKRAERGKLVGRTDLGEPSDELELGRDRSPVQRRVGGLRASEQERPDGGGRGGRDERGDQRDRQEHQRSGAGGQGSRRRGA